MRCLLTLSALVAATLLLAACAAPPPPEFAQYTAAFQQSDNATKTVMAVWAPIEKAERQPDPGVFNPDDAPYIADEGRPGNAALIERGFAAIAAYNEILSLYASGQSLSSLKPQTAEFATNVGALALTVGLPGVGAGFGAAVKGLEAVAQALLAVSDRAEFARSVADNAGKLDAFLVQVRAFTSDMHRAADSYYADQAQALLAQNRREEAKQAQAKLGVFRKMLASWVLTIDATRASLAALEQAVAAQEEAGFSLAQLSYWTAELNRHAEEVKLSARVLSQTF